MRLSYKVKEGQHIKSCFVTNNKLSYLEMPNICKQCFVTLRTAGHLIKTATFYLGDLRSTLLAKA